MMSVVVERQGKQIIFSKGADTAIQKRLLSSESTKDLTTVEEFACEGLRTLAFGFRELPAGTEEEKMEEDLQLDTKGKQEIVQSDL